MNERRTCVKKKSGGGKENVKWIFGAKRNVRRTIYSQNFPWEAEDFERQEWSSQEVSYGTAPRKVNNWCEAWWGEFNREFGPAEMSDQNSCREFGKGSRRNEKKQSGGQDGSSAKRSKNTNDHPLKKTRGRFLGAKSESEPQGGEKKKRKEGLRRVGTKVGP